MIFVFATEKARFSSRASGGAVPKARAPFLLSRRYRSEKSTHVFQENKKTRQIACKKLATCRARMSNEIIASCYVRSVWYREAVEKGAASFLVKNGRVRASVWDKRFSDCKNSIAQIFPFAKRFLKKILFFGYFFLKASKCAKTLPYY